MRTSVALSIFGVFLISLLISITTAQAPAPTQNPCAIDVAACELQTQVKALRLAEAEKEIVSLRAQLGDAGGKLAAERDNSASLASKNAEKDQTISGHRETIVTVTAERDRALLKIKKANGRFLCEALNLGCVK